MNEKLDSITSYLIALLAGTHGWFMENSNSILAYGSLVLLLVRLYVDLKKARNKDE